MTSKRRPFSTLSIFKRKKKTHTTVRRKKTSNWGAIASFGLYTVAFGIFILAGYYAINFTVALRARAANSGLSPTISSETVLGFEGIPTFPGSLFIFEGLEDESVVKEFLTGGRSVYRLPRGKKIADAFEYYDTELPEDGWEKVNSVPLQSEDMRYGEYWVKDQYAIRIYSRLNDIWYQKLSRQEAETALAAEVKRENERESIVSASTGNDLLPDFPWLLDIPEEYVGDYYESALVDYEGVALFRIGSSRSPVYIEPIGEDNGTPYDTYFQRYLAQYNKENRSRVEKYNEQLELDRDNKSERQTYSEWRIESSSISESRFGIMLTSTITDGEKVGRAYTFRNNTESLVYTVNGFGEHDDFVKYILEKIQPK